MPNDQDIKLCSIVKYAYSKSAFFRKKFDHANIMPEDIKTVKDLKKIPPTGKMELITNQSEHPPFGEFLSVPINKIRRIYFSPGPIFEPQTDRDIENDTDVLKRGFQVCGVNPSDIVQVTFTYHLMPAGIRMHEAFEKMGCNVIPSGVGQTELQLELMRKLHTTVYVGTPSFLGKIRDIALQLNLNPNKDLSLRKGIFTAEPLPDSLRRELEEGFGLEAFNIYGIAEVGLVSQECEKHNGLHIHDEDLIVEVLDPYTLEPVEPGEQGELVLTTLNREAIPLIRYRTGDAVVIDISKCECGRKQPRMWIFGRVDMLTKVRGVFVYPKQVENIIKRYPELGGFQIIVDRPGRFDEMTVIAECKAPIETIDKLSETVATDLKNTLRLDVKVKFVKEGTIQKEVKILDDRRKFS